MPVNAERMYRYFKSEKRAYNIGMEKNEHKPYRALGDRLKFLREQWKQSIDEVSGTLEIDEKALKAIEAGTALPEVETLDMLISHFLLTDDQADDLRELAEESQKPTSEHTASTTLEDIFSKQIVMYLPIDNRVVYTDSMHANVNDHGVVLQFMQHLPNTSQPAVVSRVGMSREHAERMITVIQQTLKQYDYNKQQKLLQAPDPEN